MYTHAVWLVIDASDLLGVEMDETTDSDGLGREVTDTVGTAHVLATPRAPINAAREEHDVSHVPYRPCCRLCVVGREVGQTAPDTDWRP